MGSARPVLSTLALATLITASTGAGLATTAAGPEIYEEIHRWQFSVCPVPLPAGGVNLTRDTARWHFESGTFRWQKATPEGHPTGLVFEGAGRFEMTLPDVGERRQWQRMSGAEAPVDVTFRRAVLRTSEDLTTAFAGATPGECPTHTSFPLAKNRHEHYLKKRAFDVDAVIAAALATPAADYLWVEFDTEAFGWLAYQYDPFAREEITLSTVPLNRWAETWVSLDRPETRDAEGKPSGGREALIDIEHVDLEIDLTGPRQGRNVGFSQTPVRWVPVTAEVRFTAQTGGAGALLFGLTSTARLSAVRAPDGGAPDGDILAFAREEISAWTNDVRNNTWDGQVLVALSRPLVAGETRTLAFDYELQIANYAPGRGWYPGVQDQFEDLHTATMTFTRGKRQEVRACGTRRAAEDLQETWAVDDPTKMVSFSYGEKFREATLEVEGVPKVHSFGPRLRGGAGGEMIRNVGIDVANSLRYFQWLLDAPLPVDEIQLTGIAAFHGQAFDGFIHMSESTYRNESSGPTEMFRAHEAAHQWWGHEVGWQSYRDQWLSEALAEYSAMLFIKNTLKNGDKLYDEVLTAYTNLVNGSRKGAFGRFARPWLVETNLADRRRMGPICLGYRASTVEIPRGYQIQVYHRGPLVLHSLHSLLRLISPDQDLFIEILRDFVRTHRGSAPSTADFIATVNRHAPGDWQWFFDQWLCSNDIPTYRWQHRIEAAPAGSATPFQMIVEIHQEDVPEDFFSLIPIRFDYGGNRTGSYLAKVDAPQVTLTVPLAEKPKKVELNPDFSVLAKVKKM
ncbi:MAG: M1 family aminopeptidase [Acidobacteriota bacterium]